MSSQTPPDPPIAEPDPDVLDALDAPDDSADPSERSPLAWPPPGSPPDLELQRLVKARLIELMVEEGILVPETQDS